MVLSTALFDKPAFQNLIVNGTPLPPRPCLVLAADGKKMSKRLKNYPDVFPVPLGSLRSPCASSTSTAPTPSVSTSSTAPSSVLSPSSSSRAVSRERSRYVSCSGFDPVGRLPSLVQLLQIPRPEHRVLGAQERQALRPQQGRCRQQHQRHG